MQLSQRECAAHPMIEQIFAMSVSQSDVPTQAGNGRWYRSPGGALFADLVEGAWRKLEPTLRNPETIRVTREQLGLSRRALARAADLSPALLTMAEQGKRNLSEKALASLWSAMWRIDQQKRHYETPAIFIRLENGLPVATVTERL
jgi:hypothetical protein